jgi:hypothetical protein
MKSTAIGVVAAAVVAAGAAAPGAEAAGLQFRFAFGDGSPGQATTGHVEVVFPTDEQGRPRQLAGLDFEFPAGTHIDRSVAPVCTASDEQIDRMGVDACPAETQVGWGAAKAHTGFGPPVDPFPADAHTFNTPIGTVNVFTPQGLLTPAIWRTRQRYDGLWVRDIFPPPPAGFPPPDGKSLPLEAQFTLDKQSHGRSWLTTPHTCPAGRAWLAHVVVTYAGGSGDTASATTPCARPATPSSTKHTPRRATHGRRCPSGARHRGARRARARQRRCHPRGGK